MSSAPESTVVVGAGILGISTARSLAALGRKVTLVTTAGLADGASGRSLSWLNSFGPHPHQYRRLRQVGMERYRALARNPETGTSIHFDGGLFWDGSDDGSLYTLGDELTDAGYPVELVRPGDLSRVAPGVSPDAVPQAGALFVAGEGWVDLAALIKTLANELASAGGDIVTDAGPVAVDLDSGHVRSVTSRGSGLTYRADQVVLACGANVPAIAADLGISVPDATQPALILWSEPIESELRVVVNSPRIALRPHSHRGFAMDKSWAAEQMDTATDGSPIVHPETLDALLQEARAVLDRHPQLKIDRFAAGPKPVPGDGYPIVGPVPEVGGCFMAFTHSGATLGPILGELLANEVASGNPEPLLEPFRLGRFAKMF